ncbi:NAD(+) diphosphatase [Aminicella lysinilytica]|uniref:NAD(+) diphosphatase n=1 Tax=Aminicella lysinilytica TaxID=433323 RepID=A0A4R6QBP8_9FIRM|nr:NAD(+) diphosphatase [Aminicella lysinilytica]NLD11813.1 NAD(+) diphosphatase [Clostridiales bacterium]TDP59660.1 NAD+ diphosphatase [Aminicella lysinilytica]
MIQDIEPKKMKNQFVDTQVENSDSVFAFDGEQLVIHKNREGILTLPERRGMKGENGDFTYLFAIDNTRYFLYRKEIEALPMGFETVNVRGLRQITSKDVCFAAATAYHLYVWYRDNKICGRCGVILVHSDAQRMLKCPVCGNEVYPKVAPAVIVGVCDGDKILLTKYAGRAYKRYALIAGFTEIGETAEETVKREVMEEVGIKVKNIRYYKSQPWGTDSNLLLGFFADLDGSGEISLDREELSTGEWFPRDNIPVEDDGISLTRDMIEAYRSGKY